MSQHYDLDLFVIGGGSGGVRAARIAASHGARVAIAEGSRWGGTCVVRGCIPKKLFVYASEFSAHFTDAVAYGWNIERPRFDWSRLVANKDKEISRLSGLYVGNLEKHSVAIHEGYAHFVDAHTIACEGREFTAKHVLVATGGTPSSLDIPGSEHTITSDEAFDLKTFPSKVAVVGGGYIGVEFALIFAGLGAEVTLVHRRDLVLRGFDDDLRKLVTENLSKAGINAELNNSIKAIRLGEDGSRIATLTNNTNNTEQSFDQVMLAVGRTPNTAKLALAAAGVKTNDKGAIPVDEFSKTNVDHIYAVGDCTGRIDLTPVAIRDGHAVADALFDNCPRPIDHDTIATAVFCQPTAATVGLTEAQAEERGIRTEVLRTGFRPLRATVSGSQERIMIKVIVDKDDERVLGAHMVGRDAAEIIQVLAIAIKKGITRADLNRTVALHPTTAEELVLL